MIITCRVLMKASLTGKVLHKFKKNNNDRKNLNMRNYIWFIFACSVICFSCKQSSKKSHSQQSFNTVEINKAKEYFSADKDSLKLKALNFLIDNMPGKYGMDAKSDSANTEYYHKILQQTKKGNFDISSISNNHGSAYNTVNDVEIIDSAYLIENIEYAFKAWGFPWAAHLSFDEFCRYILPYRLKNEALSPWRKHIFDKLSHFTDSLIKSGTSNPVDVCKALNNYVMVNFQWVSFNAPLISIKGQFNNPVGVCDQRLFYTAALGRAIGLPIAIDYTPQYPRYPGNHEWNVLTNNGNNEIVAFNGGDEWVEFPFHGLKIYRYVFENVCLPDVFAAVTDQLQIVDVTTEYPFPYHNLVFDLKERNVKNDVYLFAFGIGQDIVPMALGEVKGKRVIFSDIVANQSSMVLIAEHDRGKITVLENPIELKPNNDFHVFEPSKELVRSVRLYRKYTLNHESEFFEKIGGVKIQGANKRDFSDALTLFENDSIPQTYYEMHLNNNQHFNYYRYLPNDTTSINVAELHFIINENGITGRSQNYITGMGDEAENLRFAYDDDISTNYNSEVGHWVGIDVSDKAGAVLLQVNVLARNSLNVISIGHEYELFYFDKRWLSLGTKRAEKYHIDFEGVPYNSLLLLKNHTTGRQERIFTYNDEWQIWW